MADYNNIDEKVYAILKTYLGDDVYCQIEGDTLVCKGLVNDVECKVTFTDMAEGLAKGIHAELLALYFLGTMCYDIKNA